MDATVSALPSLAPLVARGGRYRLCVRFARNSRCLLAWLVMLWSRGCTGARGGVIRGILVFLFSPDGRNLFAPAISPPRWTFVGMTAIRNWVESGLVRHPPMCSLLGMTIIIIQGSLLGRGGVSQSGRPGGSVRSVSQTPPPPTDVRTLIEPCH